MGWWSEGIMGGDTPLDAVGELEKAIGWDYGKDGFIYEAENAEAAGKKMSTKTGREKVERLLRQMKDGRDMENGSVLAVVEVLMHVGFKITREIEEIARDAAEKDEWANESEDQHYAGPNAMHSPRMQAVLDFLRRLDIATGKAKPQTYRVSITRKSFLQKEFDVVALTASEAEDKAMQLAQDTAYDLGDEVDHDYEIEESHVVE